MRIRIPRLFAKKTKNMRESLYKSLATKMQFLEEYGEKISVYAEKAKVAVKNLEEADEKFIIANREYEEVKSWHVNGNKEKRKKEKIDSNVRKSREYVDLIKQSYRSAKESLIEIQKKINDEIYGLENYEQNLKMYDTKEEY